MEHSEFYKSMLDNIYEGIYFVDDKRQITFWNKGAERMTGFLAEDIVGKFCYHNILNHVSEAGTKLCLLECPLHKTLKDGTMRETVVYLHHKEGHRVPVSIRAVPIYEGDSIIGAVELFTDQSERHETLRTMEEYKQLAMKDQLTGLANRRYMDAFLESKISEFKTLGIPFGLLFMDLDKFKLFNDEFGHDVGDEVLKMVAKTSLAITRSTDVICRYGGEEFVAILVGLDAERIKIKAEQLRTIIETAALRLDNKVLGVTISIGATLVNDEDTAQSILKRADELLYKSKENGRNLVSYE